MHPKPALLLLTTVAALLALCAPAYAQDGAETHDGFMVRLGIGFGVSNATFQERGLPDLELEASASNAGHINVALGYAVIDNLIVHADLFGGFLAEPTVTRGDTELGDLDGTQLNLYGFGLGLTYYIMPLNLYVAGSFGAARVVFDLDGEAYELDDASGTALQFAVGKEWWVSANWGLGVAAQYYRLDMEYANGGEMDASSVGLLFSATYN